MNTDNAVFNDELADLAPAAPLFGIPADPPPAYDTATEDLLMNLDGSGEPGPAIIDPSNLSLSGAEENVVQEEDKQETGVVVTELEDTEMTDVSS